MALKALLTKAEYEKLPDVLKSEYVAEGDDFVLDVDEKPYKARVDDFRSTNVNLMKKQAELEKQMAALKDVDPAEYAKMKKLMEQLEKSEEAALLKEGKFDEVVEKRVTTMKATYDRQVAEMQKALEAATQTASMYKSRYSDMFITNTITEAVNKVASPRKSAISDIINRARSVWSVDENGQLVGKDLFNKKGQPMNVEEWATALVADAPHLFESAQGGGAGGGAKRNQQGSVKVVPNDPISFGQNLEAIAKGTATVEGYNND